MIIQPSTKDPEVDINSLSGKMFIRGKCINEHPEGFFSPVYEWLETHLPAFPDEIECRINLSACRPQALLEIARLLRLLEKNIMQKKKIAIIWQYQKEDEEMQEAGVLLDKMIRKEVQFESN